MKTNILLIVIGLAVLITSAAYSKEYANSKKPLLSGTEIDLLVGTPQGISEPLDFRRNNITKDNQIDYSGFLDENGLTEDLTADIPWEDAEDSAPSENQVESQLMDLLAETEELEKTDSIYYYDEDKDEETASESRKISSQNNQYELFY